MIRALTPLTHPVIMGQGEVDRCSGANSGCLGCSGLVVKGRALRHSSALPTVSGAGAGVLGGAAGQYWEPWGCWLVQALAPGF